MQLILINLLAQPAPVRILTGNEIPAPSASPNYFAWASALCIILAISLALWRMRSLNRRPAEIRAFELLANRLSITPPERTFLHRMAAIHGSISPLAMLVSPAAFQTCRQAIESRSIGMDRSALASLTRKLSAH